MYKGNTNGSATVTNRNFSINWAYMDIACDLTTCIECVQLHEKYMWTTWIVRVWTTCVVCVNYLNCASGYCVWITWMVCELPGPCNLNSVEVLVKFWTHKIFPKFCLKCLRNFRQYFPLFPSYFPAPEKN